MPPSNLHSSPLHLLLRVPLLLLLLVACCGGAKVEFERVVVDDELHGNYGVALADLTGNQQQDAVAYAWGAGKLVVYSNPAWTKHVISSEVPFIVSIDFVDVDGDGLLDIVTAFNLTLPHIQPGTISWLKNPGTLETEWKRLDIGHVDGAHRLLWLPKPTGVVVAPIFGRNSTAPDFDDPAVITFFPAPEEPLMVTSWTSEVWNDEYFHIVHHLVRLGSGIVIGSMEGVSFMEVGGSHKITHLVDGAPPHNYTPYKGTNVVGFCKLGQQHSTASPFGYLATIGPWEGIDILSPTVVQVHLEQEGFQFPTPNSTLLTTLGSQGHTVACGDFNNDGIEGFIVGLRGPMKALVVFEPVDESGQEFHSYTIHEGSNEGASMIATADLNGDGRLDFVATGFPGFGAPSEGDHFFAVYLNQGVQQCV